MFSINTGACEYGDTIRQFFQSQFPYATVKSSGDVLELLTDAIVASGKVRLGPKPSIESLFAIRGHLSAQMAAGEPIRFLMPWGSEKPVDLQTVDLAEVSALKTLSLLQKRVQEVYQPGIHIRIRVEDATAPNLFDTDRPRARTNAKVYSDSFDNLITVLEMQSYIQTVRETTMVTEESFEIAFGTVYPAMLEYLQTSEYAYEGRGGAQDALIALGWVGSIPFEQREHYRATYRRLYGMNDEDATKMLARYMAQSLTRRRLDMMGNLDWKDYLGLSFVGPVPGEPKGHAPKRIYYRTLPESVSSYHIAPWRAKGYLSISNDGARPRLASWAEHRSYNPMVVTLTNGECSVNVRADYEVS